MQRLFASLVAVPLLLSAANAQCFEQNFGVLAPLAAGQAGYGDDVFFDLQPLGFNFPMAGNAATYSHVHISDNGIAYLTNGTPTTGAMGAGNGYQNTAYFVGDVGADPRIAPSFADYWSQPGSGGGVFINNTIPGKFVITWANMVEWWQTTQPGVAPQFTFQAQIFANGDVTFAYGPTTYGANYASQIVTRVGLSEGNGVLDPTPVDLTIAGGNTYLTDFVMYEEFPFTVWDLADTALEFVWVGSGYVQSSSVCTPAFNQGYGQGCYDISDSFYQLLEDSSTAPAELDGQSLVMTPAGSEYLVSWGGASYVTPVAATSLAIGDDGEIAQPLTTAFPTPAGNVGTLYVGANAVISVDANPVATEYVPIPANFLNSAITGWYSHHDYNPTEAGSGPITFFETATHAYFTWEGVESYAAAVTPNPSTLQFQFNVITGEVAIVWVTIDGDPSSPFGSAHLIGYSTGGPSTDGGSQDLSAVPPFVTSPLNVDRMTLSASPAPISTATTGTTVVYTAGNMPAFAPGLYIGLNILSLGQNAAGIDLGFIGAPGCNGYVLSIDFPQAMVGTTPTNSVNLPIPMGITPGFEIYSQAISLVVPNSLPNGQNNFGMVVSNGVRTFISTF